MTILHITFDGILQPLGRSQVVFPTIRLAERGYPYALVSLERRVDLECGERVRAMEERLTAAGVPWVRNEYVERGTRAAISNLRTMVGEVLRLCRRFYVQLIHARGYQAALVARAVQPVTGVRYLFDTRGCWIDELRLAERWGMQHAFTYAIGKRIERWLFAGASGAVCLTEAMRRDVVDGVYGTWPTGRPVRTIPTCADYESFARPLDSDRVRALRDRLAGTLVIGYVGSVNRTYDISASMALFRAVYARRPDARLLCLTRQLDAMRAALREHGVPEGATVVESLSHEEVPAALRLLQWGLLLLNPDPSRNGKMPTRLGEFFAAGVRPIQGGGNPDICAWVERAGTGICLPDYTQASIEAAAEHIARSGRLDERELARMRERTEPYFGLESGVRRYAELLEELGVSRQARRPR